MNGSEPKPNRPKIASRISNRMPKLTTKSAKPPMPPRSIKVVKPPTPISPAQVRTRLFAVYLCFVFFFSLVTLRLLQLQVWPNAEIEAQARRQFQKVGKKAPFRLPILDRNGEELAVSVPASSVFARPKLVRRKRETARILAKYLGGGTQRWLIRLQTQKPFIWMSRQVSEEVAKKIDKLSLPGIFVEPENRRIYPNEQLASNVLGFTDIDGNGLSGLELSLNEELLQKESSFPILRDGRGTPSYIDQKYNHGKNGSDAVGINVTLDRRLQHALEEELTQSLEDTKAKGVLAVVMDPFTGEIFALGQRPTFDPNRARDSSDLLFANRLISYLFEPGSTMKVLFAAEAIETGIMNRKTPVDCGGGELAIGNRVIHEAEADHNFDFLSLEKVIRYSSNVGAAKVVQQLGAQRTRQVLERYNLTSKLGINLPGEVGSNPKEDYFSNPFQLATAGFGQGIAVTPLQMVSAYAPFANGGFLVRPKILLSETSAAKTDGKWDIKRVLSPKTVDTMKEILVSVTEEKGTGIKAAIPGLRVAGKTGTAQKYEANSGYEKGRYFSSFIGFLPADRPELLVGVMVDEPKNGMFASQVAAPLFRRIAERSLQILDRTPKRSLAKADLVEIGESGPIAARTETVVGQIDGKLVMPDLKGLSVREALQVMGKVSGSVRLIGNGYLQEQLPKAGDPVSAKSAITLNFAPPAG